MALDIGWIKFSPEEAAHIVLASAVLAYAFGGTTNFLITFSFVAVLFFLHEACHKYFAGRYDAETLFSVWPLSAVLAVLTSLFGFVVAGPGGTAIFPKSKSSKLDSKEIGMVALAGPMANLVLGLILLAARGFSPSLFTFAAKISIFLAVINLLPVGPLDGAKIGRFSWVVWGIALAVSLAAYLLIR